MGTGEKHGDYPLPTNRKHHETKIIHDCGGRPDGPDSLQRGLWRLDQPGRQQAGSSHQLRQRQGDGSGRDRPCPISEGSRRHRLGESVHDRGTDDNLQGDHQPLFHQLGRQGICRKRHRQHAGQGPEGLRGEDVRPASCRENCHNHRHSLHRRRQDGCQEHARGAVRQIQCQGDSAGTVHRREGLLHRRQRQQLESHAR